MRDLAALPEADVVLVAVLGTAGIEPTLAALKAGKRVALANKETLVA
ncbi:MAG TPA: 1-deoxy-D-xylulose-5-phosphate reductoisomerase, partial [Firmicutes bacterium]|nr:1-deoxy-D-xylulose-5-phosphate reductoisomerase [Bacillota bacterium]